MPSSSTGTGIAAQAVDLEDLQGARIRRRLPTMISSPGSARLCATIAMPCVEPVSTMMLAGHDGRCAARVHPRRDRRAQRLVALRVAVRQHEPRIARDAAERLREFAERRRLVGRDALHERDAARFLLGREFAETGGPLGNSPTRHGGSVTHHGTPAARSGWPPRSCGTTRDPEPTRCSMRPSPTSSRYACTTVLRFTPSFSAMLRSGGSRVDSGRVPARIASRRCS